MIFCLGLAFSFACQREGSFPDVTSVPASENGETKEVPAGKLLAQVVFDSVVYIIPPEEMLQPFIDEFADGTVVDKAMIKKVQAAKTDKPGYYLVGVGQKNGSSRMMAFQLYVAEDNSLYITSSSRKHVTTSTSCAFCLFTFSKNMVSGAQCEDSGKDLDCTYTTSDYNKFML